MPLSKFIIAAYKPLIEIALWVTLLLLLIAGDYAGGFVGLIIGGVLWLIIATVLFGALLLLIDIQERVRNIETQKQTQTES